MPERKKETKENENGNVTGNVFQDLPLPCLLIEFRQVSEQVDDEIDESLIYGFVSLGSRSKVNLEW